MVLFIYGNKRHGLPATGSHCNFEHIGRSHGPFFDAIVFGILRRIRSVGIDRCSISHTGLQEAEFLGQCPGLIVRAGAQEETVPARRTTTIYSPGSPCNASDQSQSASKSRKNWKAGCPS